MHIASRRSGQWPERRPGVSLRAMPGLACLALLVLAVPRPARADIFYYRASMDSLGTPVARLSVSDSVRGQRSGPVKPAPSGQPGVIDKVHPRLRSQLLGSPNDTVTVLVTLRDTVDIASPDLLQFQKQALRDTLIRLRRPDYDSLRVEFAGRYGAREVRRYWLIRSMLLRMPANRVDSLAARPDIIRLEPVRGGAPPTGDDTTTSGGCGSSSTPVRAAREQIGSDAYLENGYGRSDLALFDTGVRGSHVLLSSIDRIVGRFTCQTGSGVCQQDPGQWDENDKGHGTSSAAILTGDDPNAIDPVTGAPSTDHRGLTQAGITSFKVYDEDDSLSFTGAVDAFQNAMILGSPTIVAEIAETEGDGIGSLAEAANKAFDREQMVIAAMGNTGSTLTTPGAASQLFGVGAYCIGNGYFFSEYVRGTTVDGRYKPDLTGPTSVYTATNTSYQGGVDDDHGMATYGGTSCATAVAGGAAHLLRDRLSAGLTELVPVGAAYAALMLAADPEATGGNVLEGAGRLRLPGEGVLVFGSLDITQDELVSLPVSAEIADGKLQVSAAIWWPEPGVNQTDASSAATRADIDLLLLDPSGRMADSSLEVNPVYERVEAMGNPDDVRWTLQVFGARVPAPTRKVYWAAWLRQAH